MIGLIAFAITAATKSDPRCTARVGFYQPRQGVISTPRMATAISEIYLEAIYGSDVIAHELPLKASIKREVWHVEGVLSPGSIGGVAEIDLCQATGQVLRIIHGK